MEKAKRGYILIVYINRCILGIDITSYNSAYNKFVEIKRYSGSIARFASHIFFINL